MEHVQHEKIFFLKPIFALSLMLIISACQPQPMTEQEQRTVTELTANMKTQCVGRYLIDLPADIDTFGRAKLRDIDVEVEAMTQQEFLDGMQKREAKLRATKSLLSYQFLYGDREYPPSQDSTETLRKKGIWHFISLGRDGEPSDANRVIEAYKWDRGYRIKLQIEASDFARSEDRDEPWVQEMSKEDQNDVLRKLHAVLTMLYQFRGLSAGEIPKEPGVCLTGGFIQTVISDGEEVSVAFQLNRHRDVNFRLESEMLHQSNSLLQRGAAINNMLENSDGRTVRKSAVNLQGLQEVEEWLTSGLTVSHIQGHYFTLEANSTIGGNAKTPLLIFNMRNGAFPEDIPDEDKTRASLTEGEAVALWDAVSRTIRVRPGAMDAMPLAKVDTRLPLGTLTRSGQLCRQPGHCRAYWNGKTYRMTLYPGRPAPTLNLMEPVPYRWLPSFINSMLLKNERLPMVLVEHEVDWELTSYFL
jgi:hypothetical protein